MTDQVQFPTWIIVGARISELTCDGGLIAAALIATRGAPLSVATALGSLQWAWILLLCFGGICAGIGSLKTWFGPKLAGCALSIGGLGMWIASLLGGRHVTSGQGVLALILLAGIGLQLYRVFVCLASAYLLAERAQRAV